MKKRTNSMGITESKSTELKILSLEMTVYGYIEVDALDVVRATLVERN